MKTIVVYQSSTGFTKQYAEWIGEALSCEVTDIKEVTAGKIREYGCIIYGGWIMGGNIAGLDKIVKLNPTRLVIFAVGATPDGEEIRSTIKEQNHIGDKPFFYMEGGMRFERLNFMIRAMLKIMVKTMKKKQNKTSQDEYMEGVMGTSFDNSDKKYIEPLVSYIRGLND
jgi:menaquinone-dependent protoporphyrinogen IX oxidase